MKQLPEQPKQEPSKPEQTRGYRLFPRERQLPVLNNVKALDLAKATAMATSQKEDKVEQPSTTTSLKTRINQHSLVRRRKVSVPELGPMTTVHEVPMDSRMSILLLLNIFSDQVTATIPGRPPLHERSVSAPAEEYRPADSTKSSTLKPDRPESPKRLAPLIIPLNATKPPTQLLPKRSTAQPQNGSIAEETPRTNRTGDSPKRTLFTPQSLTTESNTAMTAGTNPTSAATLPTPVSAPAMDSHRPSPKPFEGRSNTPTIVERAMTPQPVGSQRIAKSHRRGASESSTTDRGRARKRNDSRHHDGSQRMCDTVPEKSTERKTYDELPTGSFPKDAIAQMEANEINRLQKQAFQQAERSEVLRSEDVEALSKELRHLDERTEYLRRTYTSLRAGRRNLHTRMCQFLTSARVAKFSYESMIKQHEALAELDASIEDWVNKLDVVENRRTRVRQKLLEHVAAAAILNVSDVAKNASESLQHAVGIPGSTSLHHITTPPRSPSKPTSGSFRTSSNSPSPQRVVAQVPSTILENPIVEEAEALSNEQAKTGPAALKRADVESIRIYAGDEIYALLADVENEITNMSSNAIEPFTQTVPEPERKKLNRQRSHEILNLNGRIDTSSTETLTQNDVNSAISESSQAPAKDLTPPKQAPDELFLLSNAVFKP